MGFWIYMLIMASLLPATLLVCGIYFYNRAPKNINFIFGYRTSQSMKNMDTWKFAHRYCGRICIIGGGITLPFSIISMLLVFGKSTDTVGFVGAGNLILPMISIIVSVILTESALKKNFDKFGRRKN